MSLERRKRRYGYADQVDRAIEESRKVRAEWRALTRKLEEQQRVWELAEERRRLMRLEREAARDSE